MELVREKVAQAVQIVRECEVDAWATFVRETSLTPDPALDLVLGLDIGWPSVFLVGRSGETVAVVGHLDAGAVEQTGAYSRVLAYEEEMGPALIEALSALDPATIALNYAKDDPAADGLSHGLFLRWHELLDGTPYASRSVSAREVVGRLRGRKSRTEVERIRAAIATTERLLAELGDTLRVGETEREIAERLTVMYTARHVEPAWDAQLCPIVNAGPGSYGGHALPSDRRTAPGHLLHVDFGIRQDGYCADLKRMWYFAPAGEAAVPSAIDRAFGACRAAIESAAQALRPGARGWEVDAIARSSITDAGYAEFGHGLGHQLGRAAHDGGTLLGPRLPRYGDAPLGRVEAGNVFTLELGVDVPGHGRLGLEEDVLVTDGGVEWLSVPQRELWIVA